RPTLRQPFLPPRHLATTISVDDKAAAIRRQTAVPVFWPEIARRRGLCLTGSHIEDLDRRLVDLLIENNVCRTCQLPPPGHQFFPENSAGGDLHDGALRCPVGRTEIAPQRAIGGKLARLDHFTGEPHLALAQRFSLGNIEKAHFAMLGVETGTNCQAATVGRENDVGARFIRHFPNLLQCSQVPDLDGSLSVRLRVPNINENRAVGSRSDLIKSRSDRADVFLWVKALDETPIGETESKKPGGFLLVKKKKPPLGPRHPLMSRDVDEAMHPYLHWVGAKPRAVGRKLDWRRGKA